MVRYLLLLFLIPVLSRPASAQNYTSYHTGNDEDVVTQPEGGICMMGGSSEDDEAMRWFLKRTAGGDVLVLRTSGSDGYNDYMYSGLGVAVNSVETIVCNNAASAGEGYIHDRISRAEAIWFAGGDQDDYVRYWRNTKIDSLINDGISRRHMVIGGTSAGMAIMGGYIYTGKNGSVTSAQALANPYHTRVTIDSAKFIENPYLQDVITDTHYDNPDRRGRHITFLARIMTDFGITARGIACDEYTAVCIDETGLARVFGEYPSSNDNAYFIQPNCALADNSPENCTSGDPLQWLRGNKALWVYKVKGTKDGNNTFDLKDWVTGSGGVWEDWYVNQGTLGLKASTQTDCSPLATAEEGSRPRIRIAPNPVLSEIVIKDGPEEDCDISIADLQGRVILTRHVSDSAGYRVDMKDLPPGVYFIVINTGSGNYIHKIIKL